MATEKILIFDEAGNAKRMKVRIARFLDNEPVTSSDKENIRETLGVDDSLSGTFTTPLSVTSANDSSFTGGGKVGIGGSPTYELDVQAANARIAATSSAGIVNHLQADNTAAYVGPLSNHALVIKTNNTERMRIKSDGKFAFGHSSPNAEFSIKGDTEFLDGDTGTRIGLLYDNGTEGIFELRDNNTTKVSLRSAGNSSLTGGGLGVGADPGSTVMRVSGGSGQLFKIDDGANALLVCDATGEVGIGTSSPDAGVHLKKASGETIFKAEVGGNSTVGFEIKKTGSTTQGWRIVDGQTVNGTLEFYDVTNSATRWSINSSGNLIGSGGGQILYNDGDCLFVGDSGNLNWDRSASTLILGAGAGIDFSSGGASSVMDDYERGTGDPTDESGAGLTLAGRAMNYVKIGSQVTVWVTVTYPTTSDTSSASVGSFPFAFGSSNIDRIGGVAAYSTYAGTLTALGVTGTGRVHFINEGVTLTNANLSGKVIWFSVTYDVS